MVILASDLQTFRDLVELNHRLIDENAVFTDP